MKKLRIQPEQWEAFAADAEERFLERLCATLTHSWPERCAELGPAGTRELAEEAIVRAQGHGLREQEQITRFAQLCFLIDVDFDDLPWAATILAWEVAPARKLDLLERGARERSERGEL